MKIYVNKKHALHHGKVELNEGKLVPCFEKPERLEFIIKELETRGLDNFVDPEHFSKDHFTNVHKEDYIEFLENVWGMWEKEHPDVEVMPMAYPVRGLRNIKPKHIDGLVSYYAFDVGTPITATSWQAIYEGACCSISAAKAVHQGEQSSFALTRPPGHHAHSDLYGGYCFINNAAVATQYLVEQGHKKVTIFDIDYHHGNGTQDIFYSRDDVQFLSIHGDPAQEFPYFLGYADEKGEGKGEGYNHNYPLAWGSDWKAWSAAMHDAIAKIKDYKPEVLVISLGVDTFKDDPISQFTLESEHFIEMGKAIAEIGIPTVFIMEGGYATEAIGVNVVNTLEGYLNN